MNKIYLDDIPPSDDDDIIGLFGGSFNPPHEGHLLVAKQAFKYLNLTKIWWMVSPGNPLKDNSNLPTLEKRVEWCKELLRNENNIIITGFEKSINSSNSFTTIKYILNKYKKTKFIWLMGGDSLENFDKWYNWHQIVQMLPICIIKRPTTLYPEFNSQFAIQYKNYFVAIEQSSKLSYQKPPAWCYIEDKLSEESSTRLRKNKMKV